METALDVIARIRSKSRERDYCLAVLELWAQAQAQGVEPEMVEAFGFDPKLLSSKDAKRYCAPGATPNPFIERRRNGSWRTLMHNYVRFKDGATRKLDPMLKAVCHFDDND